MSVCCRRKAAVSAEDRGSATANDRIQIDRTFIEIQAMAATRDLAAIRCGARTTACVRRGKIHTVFVLANAALFL